MEVWASMLPDWMRRVSSPPVTTAADNTPARTLFFADTLSNERTGMMEREDPSKAGALPTHLRWHWAKVGQAEGVESSHRYKTISKHLGLKQAGFIIKYSYGNMWKPNSKHNARPFQPHQFCKSVTISIFLLLLRPWAYHPLSLKLIHHEQCLCSILVVQLYWGKSKKCKWSPGWQWSVEQEVVHSVPVPQWWLHVCGSTGATKGYLWTLSPPSTKEFKENLPDSWELFSRGVFIFPWLVRKTTGVLFFFAMGKGILSQGTAELRNIWCCKQKGETSKPTSFWSPPDDASWFPD